MEFKDKLVYVRAKLNLTQYELANQLGVSFATVNRWENDVTKPSKTAIVNFKEFCINRKISMNEGKDD